MEPGPELDRIVAEKVMGWIQVTWKEYTGESEDLFDMPDHWYDPRSRKLLTMVTLPGLGHSTNEFWRPSTNIHQAFEVVDYLREYLFTLKGDGDGEYWAGFQLGDGVGFGSSRSPEHAICLAAAHLRRDSNAHQS